MQAHSIRTVLPIPATSSQETRHGIFRTLRTDGIHNIDISLEKTFVTIKEGMTLELRGEFFNFFNTPRFAPPDTLYGDSTFGQITSTLPGSTPRHGQLGVRFEF